MTGQGPAQAGTPAALPKPGDTSTPQRIDVNSPDLTGTNYTVKQVVSLYRVSERTVMAKLRAGKVPGAAKVPGPNGEQWALPLATVAQLWELRTETPGISYRATETEQTALLELVHQLIAKQTEMVTEMAAMRSQLADLEQITNRALSAPAENDAGLEPEPAPRRRRWGKRAK
jgi:hypothetical protein